MRPSSFFPRGSWNPMIRVADFRAGSKREIEVVRLSNFGGEEIGNNVFEEIPECSVRVLGKALLVFPQILAFKYLKTCHFCPDARQFCQPSGQLLLHPLLVRPVLMLIFKKMKTKNMRRTSVAIVAS